MNIRAMNASYRRKQLRPSQRFLKALAKAGRVVFVSHVNPDPDSIGSMVGLAHLVRTKADKPVLLTRDGLIGRAENRAMVELLEIDLVPLEDVQWSASDAVVMVDSQPETGRHNLDPSATIVAVIDHHLTAGEVEGVSFVDVRRDVGATCTIVTRYLVEQEVEIPSRVATALLYGIETDINGCPRSARAVDDAAVHLLYPLADKNILTQIRHAPLPHSYFGCMLQALQSSFQYGRLIISWVHDLPQPEMAGQVADFLIRFEEVDWALCAGVYQEALVLSLRSKVQGGRAHQKLAKVVEGMGRAGGHDRRAGGIVPLPATSAHAIEQVQSELRRRLLQVLDIDESRGQRLVSVRQMIENIG